MNTGLQVAFSCFDVVQAGAFKVFIAIDDNSTMSACVLDDVRESAVIIDTISASLLAEFLSAIGVGGIEHIEVDLLPLVA